MDISIVIPAYNEQDNIGPLHEQLTSVLEGMGRTYEIIFIDDGSGDRTFEHLKAIADLDARVRVIKFRTNFGQTAALDAGIKHAAGDVIVPLDADLQNDPADIPRLVDQLDQGYDCVSGWRKKRRDSLFKHIISRGANLLRKIFIRDRIHDSGCTMKAYRKECFENLDLYGEMHRFIPALLQWRGFRIGEIEVSHHPRRSGKTKYNIVRVIRGLLDMIVVGFWMRFSARPMHLFGGLGILMAFVGFVLGAYMTVQKLAFGAELANRPLLFLAVLLILLGVQFAIFGVLADIVVKIYFSKQKLLPYTIESRLNLGDKERRSPATGVQPPGGRSAQDGS